MNLDTSILLLYVSTHPYLPMQECKYMEANQSIFFFYYYFRKMLTLTYESLIDISSSYYDV